MTENESFLSRITPDNPYYQAVMVLVENSSIKPRMLEMTEQDEKLRFGLALKLARRARGFTQFQLAEKAGVDDSYLSKIEKGIYPPPSKEVLVKIADVLNFEDRTDRLYFMLFAGRAALEDVKGTKFEQTNKSNELNL